MDDASRYNGDTDVPRKAQSTYTSHSFSKPEARQSHSTSDLRSVEDSMVGAIYPPSGNASPTPEVADADHVGSKSERSTNHDSVTTVSSEAEERNFPKTEVSKVQVNIKQYSTSTLNMLFNDCHFLEAVQKRCVVPAECYLESAWACR